MSTLLLTIPCRCKKSDYYGCAFALNSSKQFWTYSTWKHGHPQSGRNGHFPCLEIGTKNQIF